MNAPKPDAGVQRPGRDNENGRLEARVRAALDVALIVAMAAAPFLLVVSQQNDVQIQAEAAMSSIQLAQLPAP